ncbi:telethonin isoform X2 [Lepidochelys kempii]|uniref:telethonin isoform X2 n=2 Tax=Lepidochelys kempii TaxID=8472 RepID=UPI003C70314F
MTVRHACTQGVPATPPKIALGRLFKPWPRPGGQAPRAQTHSRALTHSHTLTHTARLTLTHTHTQPGSHTPPGQATHRARMFGKRMVPHSMGVLSAAELGCLVKEEDVVRHESFTAEWRDLSLSTRPQEGCCLREADDRRKETYWQQQETRFVVQRSPGLLMRLGRLGEPLARYPLPYQRALPLPLFVPADLSAKAERGATPPQLRHRMDFETALAGGAPPSGQCRDKRAVSEITKELPPVVQPSRPDFGKGDFPRSLSRSLSQEAQRG